MVPTIFQNSMDLSKPFPRITYMFENILTDN